MCVNKMMSYFANRWSVYTLNLCVLVALVLGLPGAQPAHAHGGIVVDGVPGEWCAPGSIGAFGPDTRTTLSPPVCSVGSEVLWDDYDGVNYGGGTDDVIGWATGSPPDPEIDINYFATTADTNTLYFLVGLGTYSGAGSPPHVQIAIDADGNVTGSQAWHDPLGVGTGLMGLGVNVGIYPDYLIATDVAAGTGQLYYAPVTAPGLWLSLGPVNLAWSGTGVPGVVEIAVPWSTFTGPALGPGSVVSMTVMSAHSGSSAGPSDAPATPPEDLISEVISGTFTTTPDSCPSGPAGGTPCELFGGAANVSADAFIQVTYQSPNAVDVHDLKTRTGWVGYLTLPAALLVLVAIEWRRRRAAH